MQPVHPVIQSIMRDRALDEPAAIALLQSTICALIDVLELRQNGRGLTPEEVPLITEAVRWVYIDWRNEQGIEDWLATSWQHLSAFTRVVNLNDQIKRITAQEWGRARREARPPPARQ